MPTPCSSPNIATSGHDATTELSAYFSASSVASSSRVSYAAAAVAAGFTGSSGPREAMHSAERTTAPAKV